MLLLVHFLRVFIMGHLASVLPCKGENRPVAFVAVVCVYA